MNIYEMTGYAQELMELLNAEEIDEQTVADTLEAIGADEKVDSYCKVICTMEAEIAARKAVIDRMKLLNSRAEKNIDRMKQALDGFMTAVQKPKVQTTLFCVSRKKTQAVEILNENMIPSQFIKIVPSVDKATIRKILMDGGKVAGCTLKENQSIQIR